MGTGFNDMIAEEELGGVPRAIEYIFKEIERRKSECLALAREPPQFSITVSFIELYNDEIRELLGKENASHAAQPAFLSNLSSSSASTPSTLISPSKVKSKSLLSIR
eukprot:Sdes_comp17696_c1_seq1m6964